MGADQCFVCHGTGQVWHLQAHGSWLGPCPSCRFEDMMRAQTRGAAGAEADDDDVSGLLKGVGHMSPTPTTSRS